MLDHQIEVPSTSGVTTAVGETARSEKVKTVCANKRSYTVTCSSRFRDDVNALANQQGVNVADLARSVTLLLRERIIWEFADPGEPRRRDRETVILKSGPSSGRPCRRKPRLQVRMVEGLDPVFIRRALGIALAMSAGDVSVALQTPDQESPAAANTEILMLQEELCRLRAIVSALSFDPLPNGINSREEALHILGIAPNRYPGKDQIKARFRERATIYHPDGDCGSHERMSQLNEAMEILRRSL